jgi:hypothetical protein
MLRKISTWLNGSPPDQTHHFKRCDFEHCTEVGKFEAPREPRAVSQPNDPNQWYFFCLHHVREYNDGWRYYQGMTEQQAQQSYQNDLMWNRPSWPFGHNPHMQYNPTFHDPFFFPDQNYCPPPTLLTVEEQKALYLFGLNFPFTGEELQSAYRHQVKNNHPDLHQTHDSEEKIRIINQSYASLKKVLENHKC